MNYETITRTNLAQSRFSKDDIAGFLYTSLDQYGDAKKDILKCIDYAMSDQPGQGGYMIIAFEEDKITGATVVNETGMSGFIPENIIVYIAVSADFRGKGIGRELMKRSVEAAEGDLALHVEPDNPARILYEKIGFTHKYLEMRYKKENGLP